VTALAAAIAGQPGAITEIADRDPLPLGPLAGADRILLVGTGTSLHAAELGAALLDRPDRPAVAVGSRRFCLDRPARPGDVVVLITHTGRTAYARGALAVAGVPVVPVTARGAGLPGAIETVAPERSETYTISYLAALAVLARLADGLGVPGTGPDALRAAAAAVAAVVAAPVEPGPPARSVALIGSGPAEVTAREGALKLREASRTVATAFDPELFLHGSAVPYGPQDLVVGIGPDPDGLLAGLLATAGAEGIVTARYAGPALGGHPVLDQLPLTAAVQRLASHFADRTGADPDTVITGGWHDDALWRLGDPG
jgi:glucosamine--fructose-6-phosphate aminotransferase (isomerizing)